MLLPSRFKPGSTPPPSPAEAAPGPSGPFAVPTANTVPPQHFTPPTPRARRAQAVQRLQIGLFGLAAMLLLVSLANIIMQHARQSEASQAAQVSAAPGASPAAHAATSAHTTSSDPLADIGVAPSPDAAAGDHHAAARPAH